VRPILEEASYELSGPLSSKVRMTELMKIYGAGNGSSARTVRASISRPGSQPASRPGSASARGGWEPGQLALPGRHGAPKQHSQQHSRRKHSLATEYVPLAWGAEATYAPRMLGEGGSGPLLPPAGREGAVFMSTDRVGPPLPRQAW